MMELRSRWPRLHKAVVVPPRSPQYGEVLSIFLSFSFYHHLFLHSLNHLLMANLPNLRRLFVEARTEAEENEYSRTAFYNLVLFISSVAVFSLAAQRMGGTKAGK
ncbi:hypothetical protein BJX96DRAFT_61730 [Aspergillus floccosus]